MSSAARIVATAASLTTHVLWANSVMVSWCTTGRPSWQPTRDSAPTRLLSAPHKDRCVSSYRDPATVAAGGGHDVGDLFCCTEDARALARGSEWAVFGWLCRLARTRRIPPCHRSTLS